MDEDEIAYPDLYKMRKRCEHTLDAIEKLYGPEYKYILSRFARFTANKRDFNPNIQNANAKRPQQSALVTSRNGIEFDFELKQKLRECFEVKIHHNQDKFKEQQKMKKEWLFEQDSKYDRQFAEFLEVKNSYAKEK